MPAAITSLIFDLDGLLADSEPLHYRAQRDCLVPHGVTLTEEAYVEHWVRSGRGIADWIAQHRLDLDPAELRKAKERCYLTILTEGMAPMAGAVDALGRLHGWKRLALASSSFRHSVDAALSLLGIERYFEVIVAREDVVNPKPDPEPFLLAASRLDVRPEECLVVEDAEKGIVAARRAGMASVAVPNRYTRRHAFPGADAVLTSLDDLTLELIDSIRD